MSSAKSLTVDCRLPGRLLKLIRKSNGPKIEPCGKPAAISDKILWEF